MRKLFFTAIAAIFIASTANAQWKTHKGHMTGEVSVNFSGQTIGLTNGGLKGRYFFTDVMVGRLGLNIGSQTSTLTINENGGSNGKGTIMNNMFSMSVIPGFEFHRQGTEKLSPYVGVTIPISSNSYTYAEKDVLVKNGNASYAKGNSFKIDGSNLSGNLGGTSIGLNLVAGADWYVIEALYFGFEFGWGYSMGTNNDITYTSTSVDGNNVSTTTKTTASGSTSGSLQANTTGGIRLGVRF